MARINESGCVGCGICASICPDGIEIVNRIAKIKDDNADCLKAAATSCPRQVIILDDNGSQSEPPAMSQGRGMGGGQGGGMGSGHGGGMGRGRGQGMGRGRRRG